MAPGGRRPGHHDTRAAILEAAKKTFAEDGYEQASLRAIARRASVDPALVHHYFGGKPALFVEVLHLGRDPRSIRDEIEQQDPELRGRELLRTFLAQWDSVEAMSPFVSLMQAVSSSPRAAESLRDFLTERVWSSCRADGDDAATARIRANLVATHLWGVACHRYILRSEPFASARLDDIVAWVGPSIDRAMTEPIPKRARTRRT
jgi:AcrR family transcriptional regulator